jgi:hypothetical protein
MRKMLNKYGFFIAFILVSLEVVAGPPSPGPPPPPGLPIGDGLLLLFAVALFFGFYKIYISILKKKRLV